MSRLRWLIVAVAVLPQAVAAQSLGLDPEHDLPVWLRTWSALQSRADLPRRLPGAGTATSSLFYGAPRVGSFWTAGNPAGLVDGVRDTRSDFAGAVSRQSGDYRRPLDPGAARLLQVSAQSWRAFSPRFSLLGRVAFDQERLDLGTRSDFTEPYSSSPFLTVDTSGTAVRRTRAVLEGAAGWKVGEWHLGVTTGYETRDHLTILSTLVRRTRSVTPGLVLGAARMLGSVEVGAFGRVRHTAETVLLIPRLGSGQAFDLAGYREVPGLEVPPPYQRRRQSNIASVGATLTGGSAWTHWTLYAEGDRLHERLTRQQRNDPAFDRWNELGWSAGGALQRSLGARWLFTVHGHAVSLSGDGDLALDSAGTIFHADEKAWDVETELRLLPRERSWTGTLTLRVAHESRNRRDSTLLIGTDVSSNTPTVALEVGRPLGSRVFASVGGAIAFYGPTSTLPNPATRGLVYQTYIAPEYSLYASTARPTAVSLLIRYRVSKAAEFWVSGRTERLAPADAVLSSAFTPGGSRTANSLVGGITVR